MNRFLEFLENIFVACPIADNQHTAHNAANMLELLVLNEFLKVLDFVVQGHQVSIVHAELKVIFYFLLGIFEQVFGPQVSIDPEDGFVIWLLFLFARDGAIFF